MSGFGRVAGTVFLGHESGEETHWPEDWPPPRLHIEGLNTWLGRSHFRDIAFPRATLPIPEVIQSAAMLGTVHLDPDPDGIYRRITLLTIRKFVRSDLYHPF